MALKVFNSRSLAVCLSLIGLTKGLASDALHLQLKTAESHGEIEVHSTLNLPISGMYSEYTVLRSTNLQIWHPAGDPVSGGIGVSEEFLRIPLPPFDAHAFYRLHAQTKLAPAESRIGEAILGYSTEFSREIQRLGQLPLEDFSAAFTPTNPYLAQISFDPTTSDFWNEFNLDPAVHNATNSTEPRLTDFRLNTNEFAVFQTNGFVVSPRLGTYSFGDAFYRIYIDDLPVFFSADAALHAWHRSYLSMLEELEETYLSPTLQQIILNMQGQVSALATQSNGTALTNGVRDADFFLAVARSLVTGANHFGSLGQNTRVQTALSAISSLQPGYINLFGTNRFVDFSQFQVRGHYETSQELRRYFRAMMWCALMDYRFTGSTNDNSLRELSGAVAMHLLMSSSGEFANWKKFDDIIQMFAGTPDSLNFAQLNDLLAAADITSPASLPNSATLQSLQTKIMSGQIGVQDIRSGYFFSPLTREQIKLPRSFTFSGQRFALDSWATSKVVFDDIIWDENGVPEFADKVMRRVPSALDVAFSIFGNDQIAPRLTARIANTNGHPWRDGYQYQHNLAAVRNVVDAQNSSAWTNNIYSYWLACLRELSPPTTSGEFPEVMRTENWAMKTLNTQLASWTQLRHDTVLYVKQPYTATILCSYPDGFVEPRPAFWEKMRNMALRTRDLVATLPNSGEFLFEPNVSGEPSFTYPIGVIYTNRLQHLHHFADKMATLRDISEKELSQQSLTTNETVFLQNLIEDQLAYGSGKNYNGWYPKLFYHNARIHHSSGAPSEFWDALITDVHTDPPNLFVNDPGSILHQAVGNVHMLMMAVDCGPGDVAVYAGPVLSHYEFELGPTTRRTDSEWKAELRAGNLPPSPEWTRGYLVPGPYVPPVGF